VRSSELLGVAHCVCCHMTLCSTHPTHRHMHQPRAAPLAVLLCLPCSPAGA
jgi:hypothetical protein